MRALIVCLLLSTLGVETRAFDALKYAENAEYHDFLIDVNEARREILDPNLLSNIEDRGSNLEGAFLELFLGDALQRPLTRVRIKSRVLSSPLGGLKGFSDTKCLVIEEMQKKNTSKTLSQYGIQVSSEFDINTPTLSITTMLTSSSLREEVYKLETKVEVARRLLDPETGLNMMCIVWSDSRTSVLEKDSSELEQFALSSVDLSMERLVGDEYNKSVIVEAISQLRKDEKLPATFTAALSNYKDW